MAGGQQLGVQGHEGLVSQGFRKAQGELDLVAYIPRVMTHLPLSDADGIPVGPHAF